MIESKRTVALHGGRTLAIMALSAVVLSACGGGETSTSQSVERLPVSHEEIMVSLVNLAADPYWAATWNNPQTDRDWRELERATFQIQVGGTLLTVPGTGSMDAEHAQNPRWRALATQLSEDGARALNAVKAQNTELMVRAGGQLIETCETCHREFNPGMSTLEQMSRSQQLPAVSL